MSRMTSSRGVTTLVHDLVDIVSKNGNLLLNVGPRPDGTIPAEAEAAAAWSGTMVTGQRRGRLRHAPLGHLSAKADTTVVTGHMTERQNAAFGPQDIRFTTGADAVYAICRGWPGAQATIKRMGSGSPLEAAQIADVSLLGVPGSLAWRQSEAGLVVDLPAAPPVRARLCHQGGR